MQKADSVISVTEPSVPLEYTGKLIQMVFFVMFPDFNALKIGKIVKKHLFPKGLFYFDTNKLKQSEITNGKDISLHHATKSVCRHRHRI